MFRPMSIPKSPRIVPGAASPGFVDPMVCRARATALFASQIMATMGPEVMNDTSDGEEGPINVLRVVPSRQILIHLHQANCDQLQSSAFQPGDDLADEAPLYSVRLDGDESPFHWFAYSCQLMNSGSRD